jgi:hypothetical protein
MRHYSTTNTQYLSNSPRYEGIGGSMHSTRAEMFERPGNFSIAGYVLIPGSQIARARCAHLRLSRCKGQRAGRSTDLKLSFSLYIRVLRWTLARATGSAPEEGRRSSPATTGSNGRIFLRIRSGNLIFLSISFILTGLSPDSVTC